MDYTPTVTTLTFPRLSGGGTVIPFNITLIDDVFVEDPESFQLSASILVTPTTLDGVFSTGGDTATATISDNDRKYIYMYIWVKIHCEIGFERRDNN